MRKICAYLFSVVVFVSCKVDPKINTPLPSDNLAQVVPEGWPEPKYKFENNPITEERFILGRALFYENLLSKDNMVSCGSCHLPNGAFSNPGHIISHGVTIDGVTRLGSRNSPSLFNLAWHSSFMYDGGSSHIELQPMAPLTNTLEMAEDMGSVVNKLQATTKYKSLFKSAYGDETVSSERILKSLAQFMGLIYSYDSKFDQYKRHEKNVQLSDKELIGYGLFQANCGSCHKEPLFSDFEFRSNGLPVDPAYKDNGREHITSQPGDRYKFKTPSLRNVVISFPYMHDGRFETLEQCLDHYTSAGKNAVNLDPALAQPLALSAEDRSDIIAFLNTLTDYKLINDKRFADPNFK